jgi:hypothetical protein
MHPQIGGSFAPPIDAEKLKNYKRLAQSADPKTRSIMLSLIQMVAKFTETPKSKMNGHSHPVGRGTITPLEATEIERIDDVVPWDYECDAMQVALEKVQQEETFHNENKLNAWRDEARKRLFPQHFEGMTLDEFDEKQYLARLYNRDIKSRPILKRIMSAVGFSDQDLIEQNVNEFHTKINKFNKEVQASLTNDTKPELESTEIRDAAFHLLWYAKELTLDREPITSDMI